MIFNNIFSSVDVTNTECICNALMGILKNGLQKRHTGQVYFDEEGIMGGGEGWVVAVQPLDIFW